MPAPRNPSWVVGCWTSLHLLHFAKQKIDFLEERRWGQQVMRPVISYAIQVRHTVLGGSLGFVASDFSPSLACSGLRTGASQTSPCLNAADLVILGPAPSCLTGAGRALNALGPTCP